jgi:hypothetical protein
VGFDLEELMPYWIYSSESLPNPALMGKPGYTPDAEYVGHGGFRIGVLEAAKWTQLPNYIKTLHHKDWLDRKGTEGRVYMDDVIGPIRTKFGGRGVMVFDHDPTPEEKKEAEIKSQELNLAWRMQCVEWYENQVREKEVTGKGRTTPTPYEDECYTILKLTKPYSVEAMRAQRHPGEAVGEQMVAALERLLARKEQEAKNEKASHPKQPAPAGA